MSKKNQIANHRGAAVDERLPAGVTEATYLERARSMTTETQGALIERMRARFAEITGLVELDSTTRIAAANLARDMGREIELFTGHQKLLPLEFNRFAPALKLAASDSPSLAFARACLSAHQQYAEPITELAVANEIFEQVAQLLLDLPKPSHGEQTAHPREPVKEFWTEAGRLANHQQRLRELYDNGAIHRQELELYREEIKKRLVQFAEFGAWLASVTSESKG